MELQLELAQREAGTVDDPLELRIVAMPARTANRAALADKNVLPVVFLAVVVRVVAVNSGDAFRRHVVVPLALAQPALKQ